MTRKDSEKDAERPHYYSQFWLDVAAGRRVIGTPKTEEGADQTEAETPEPEPTPLRKAGRNSTATVADGYKETRLPSVAEPAFEPEEEEEEDYVEPEQDEVELADNVDDLELPTLDVDETFDDADISGLDISPEVEEEVEDEDYLDDEEEEEEEEEEEDEWAARGRKKPKPGRPVKQPKVKKPKREPRRGY